MIAQWLWAKPGFTVAMPEGIESDSRIPLPMEAKGELDQSEDIAETTPRETQRYTT